MNTQLLTQESQEGTTLERDARSSSSMTQRVSLVDRAALRMGLALIVWSRRTHRRVEREQLMLTRRLTDELRRELSDADAQRSMLAPR